MRRISVAVLASLATACDLGVIREQVRQSEPADADSIDDVTESDPEDAAGGDTDGDADDAAGDTEATDDADPEPGTEATDDGEPDPGADGGDEQPAADAEPADGADDENAGDADADSGTDAAGSEDNDTPAIDTASFDTLYDAAYLETLRFDLGAVGWEANASARDLLFAVLQRHDELLQQLPLADWNATKRGFDDLFASYGLSNRFAQEIFVRAAHLFWLELVQSWPWGLADLDADELQLVYAADPAQGVAIAAEYKSIADGNISLTTLGFSPEDLLSITPFGHMLLWPLAHPIVAGATTHAEAAVQLVEWVANNVFHPYTNSFENEAWPITVYADKNTTDVIDYGQVSVGYYDYFDMLDERVGDCHKASQLLKALAAALGIPSVYGEVYHRGVEPHGALYFPTLGRMVHGDWMADFVGIPGDAMLLTLPALSAALDGGQVTGDYVTFETNVKAQYCNQLALTRKDNDLILVGWLDAPQTQSDAMKAPLVDLGFEFTPRTPCAEGLQCWQPTAKRVPIRGLFTLIAQ